MSQQEIATMVELIRHRGPDGHGVYISPSGACGLGHARLAIVDLSAFGAMPMSNRSKTLWITFNGEIYNYKKLRKELEAKGITFVSQTDTEVILHLYELYGVNCLQYLDGMFAFAILDDKKQELFIARDRLGKKPVKYYYDNKIFIFASELKSFLHHPEVRTGVDTEAIYQYLGHVYVPRPHTGFSNIHKLEPGHYIFIQNGRVEKHRYWSMPQFHYVQKSQEEWREALTTTLSEAVEKRLMGDVPVGAFLSGGFDSSTLVALAAQKCKDPLKTFSLGFDSSDSYNELPDAKRVSEMYHTEHFERVLKPSFIDLLPKIVRHMEEPFADASTLPHVAIAGEVGKHVKVALSGNGSDEIFLGYTRYRYEQLLRFLSLIPMSLRAKLASEIGKHEPLTSSWKINRLLRKFEKFSALDRFGMRYHGCIYAFTPSDLQKAWRGGYFQTPLEDYFVHHLESCNGNSAAEKAMWVDMHSYLIDDVLVKEDMVAMMFGLEVRNPFLDMKLIDLTQGIPPGLKIHHGKQKYIFKETFKHLLPAENVSKPKHGFVFPVSQWLQHDLKDFLGDHILGSDSYVSKYIDPSYISKIYHEHTKGILDRHQELWTLLILELWHKEVARNLHL